MIVIGTAVIFAGTVVISLAEILRAKGKMVVQADIDTCKYSVSDQYLSIQRLHSERQGQRSVRNDVGQTSFGSEEMSGCS